MVEVAIEAVAPTVAGSSLRSSVPNQGTPIPFGYATGKHRGRWATALHTSLTACSLLFVGNALLFHWPAIFASDDVPTLASHSGALTLCGIIAGLWLGYRTRFSARLYLAEAAFGLALLVQLVPWLYWLGFDGRLWLGPMLRFLPGFSTRFDPFP